MPKNNIPSEERYGGKPHTLTKEERAKGGYSRAQSIRESKKMKELIDEVFSREVENEKGEVESLKKIAAINLIKKAAKGDLKALELSLKLNGELNGEIDLMAKNKIKISIGK